MQRWRQGSPYPEVRGKIPGEVPVCAAPLWTPGAIACSTRPRSQISVSSHRCPSPTLPTPWASLSQGAGRTGRGRASDLWAWGFSDLLSSTLPRSGAQGIETLRRRPALHHQDSDGNGTVLPPVLTCSWESMAWKDLCPPHTHSPAGLAVAPLRPPL